MDLPLQYKGNMDRPSYPNTYQLRKIFAAKLACLLDQNGQVLNRKILQHKDPDFGIPGLIAP